MFLLTCNLDTWWSQQHPGTSLLFHARVSLISVNCVEASWRSTAVQPKAAWSCMFHVSWSLTSAQMCTCYTAGVPAGGSASLVPLTDSAKCVVDPNSKLEFPSFIWNIPSLGFRSSLISSIYECAEVMLWYWAVLLAAHLHPKVHETWWVPNVTEAGLIEHNH